MTKYHHCDNQTSLTMRLLYSRHLEHFLAVYEARSLRKAADACGVTQPALSKSLKVLESALSVSLFVRQASGVLPTQAAEALRRHALHIVNSSRYIELEVGMVRGGQTGTLRIGSGMVWNATRMPALVTQLNARFPRLEIYLHTGLAESLTPRLLDGQLDVVFAALPPQPLPEGFSTVSLPTANMVVFARTGHPLARKKRITLQDLLAWNFFGFSDDPESQRQTEIAFGAVGLRAPRMLLRSSSLETLLTATAASDSLTILNQLLTPRAKEVGLAPLRLVDPLWRIRMGISYRTQGQELAPVKALIQLAGSGS